MQNQQNTNQVIWFKTNSGITLFLNGIPYFIKPDASNYAQVLDAIKQGADSDALEAMVGNLSIIMSWSDGNIGFSDDAVYLLDEDGDAIRDTKFPDGMVRKLKEFIDDELPHGPLVNFWRRCMANPEEDSKQQLFGWIEHQNLPITPDGMFIAYKAVSKTGSGLVDKYTGTIGNNPGDLVEMPRDQVTHNPSITCAAGLHVANWSYAHGFATKSYDTLVTCLVDPADVVSVPNDYNGDKIRVCKYRVLGEIDEPTRDQIQKTQYDKPESTIESTSNPISDEPIDRYLTDKVSIDFNYLGIVELKSYYTLTQIKNIFKDPQSYKSIDQGYGHFLKILKDNPAIVPNEFKHDEFCEFIDEIYNINDSYFDIHDDDDDDFDDFDDEDEYYQEGVYEENGYIW